MTTALKARARETIVKPILRWAGAKNWLAPVAGPLFAAWVDEGARYIEPFLGSASVALAVNRPGMVLSDALESLVEFYEVVRDDPGALAWALSALAIPGVDKENYYRVRDMRSADPIQRAARFFFLNRLGFNGLYRENKKGEFNVPYGDAQHRKSVVGRSARDAIESLFPNKEKIHRVSEVLKTAVLGASDFEPVIDEAGEGDLVYVDSPYDDTFDSYAKGGFGVEGQERLAIALYRAHERGAVVVAHNALVARPEGSEAGVRYWYGDWCEIVEFAEKRSIAARGSSRTRAPCVLMSNNSEIQGLLERRLRDQVARSPKSAVR